MTKLETNNLWSHWKYLDPSGVGIELAVQPQNDYQLNYTHQNKEATVQSTVEDYNDLIGSFSSWGEPRQDLMNNFIERTGGIDLFDEEVLPTALKNHPVRTLLNQFAQATDEKPTYYSTMGTYIFPETSSFIAYTPNPTFDQTKQQETRKLAVYLNEPHCIRIVGSRIEPFLEQLINTANISHTDTIKIICPTTDNLNKSEINTPFNFEICYADEGLIRQSDLTLQIDWTLGSWELTIIIYSLENGEIK